MDTYEEIIRLMREMYQELKHDNDEAEKKKQTQQQTSEEKRND